MLSIGLSRIFGGRLYMVLMDGRWSSELGSCGVTERDLESTSTTSARGAWGHGERSDARSAVQGPAGRARRSTDGGPTAGADSAQVGRSTVTLTGGSRPSRLRERQTRHRCEQEAACGSGESAE